MLAVKPKPFMSEELPVAVSTTADYAVTGNGDQEVNREAWGRVIDQLIQWRTNPNDMVDDGVEAPTADALTKAERWVLEKKDKVPGAPPDSVVVDPNGGIVFERRERDVTEVVHCWDDGTIEYRRFQGTQLVDRYPIS